MIMENNFAFMAFAAGKESTDGGVVKRYIGVAPVFVLGVNPSKKELESIYGTEISADPEYLSVSELDGKEVKSARLDFIVQTDEEKCGVNMKSKVSFFLRQAYRYNKDKSKVQVIDKYGRTAWVTIEQAKNHEIPMYSNGPANLDKDYRPCFIGEEELTKFLKAYLGIPEVMKYVNNTWVLVDNPQDCEARLENIDTYFKGDFTELRNIISLQAKNRVKVLFGVKTTDDNKQYQAVYTQMFVKNAVTDYSKLDKDLQDRKSNGAYPTTEFEVCNIKEYVVKPTTFAEPADFPAVDEDPLGIPSGW